MKKNIYSLSLIAFCISLLAVSCQKEMADPGSTEEKNTSEPCLRTITCSFPTMMDENGTKVSLATDGTTGWQVDDEIIIYGQRGTVKGDASTKLDPVRYQLKAADIVDPTTAVFTVDMSSIIDYPDPDTDASRPFNAAVGDDWDFYSDWYSSGRARFGNTNQLLMAGYINNSGVMTLNNLCAAITFTVSGDFDTYYFSGYNGTETVGYEDYLVKMNASTPVYLDKLNESYGTNGAMTTISGPVNGNGTAINYIFIPNEANLPNGFTIVFAKSGVKTKMISSTKALTLSHGHMVNLGLLPSGKIKDYELISAAEKATATELSNPKSANCYTVSAEGTVNDNKVFKFPAVKGNTYIKDSAAGTSVGTVSTVEVLWETWNTTSVTAKTIISKLEYKDGFIYFKTPETLHEGNALIAAKDSGGNILWSWHIWAPATDVDKDTYGLGSVEMQDRNLGALVVAGKDVANSQSSGLFYQWGRKDPLRAVGSMTSNTRATTSPSGVWTTVSSQATLDVARQHPTVMYLNAVWTSESYSGLWDSTKTENDPCPVGYKVPSNTSIFAGYWDPASYNAWAWGTYGFTAGTTEDGSTTFPYSGFGYYSSGSFDYFDSTNNYFKGTRLWTITAYETAGYYRALDVQKKDESPYYSRSGTGQKMGSACAIRCIAE